MTPTSVSSHSIRVVPFGRGFATVILPQLHGNDNSIFLWSSRQLDLPVHCFYGHRDIVLDFAFRKGNSGEYQMVSRTQSHYGFGRAR